MTLRRNLAALLSGVLLTSLTACDFDGAYDLPLPGSPVDADEAYEVTAEFDDILNVVPRSPVMVDDVTVGEVIEVERVGWNAEVTLRIRDDIVLPDNVFAEIRQVSLLGEKYIAIEEPTGAAPVGRLGDSPDDHIALERTGRNPEVEEVLGALSFLLSGGGVAQLGTITEELNNAMSGREESLRSVLGSLDSVIGTLDDQKGDIIAALESVNNLTATLNRETQTIKDALEVTGPAIDVLGRQTDELVEMLGALDRLGVVGTRVINASKRDLLDQLRHLAPIVRNLTKAGDDLAPGLNLLVSFPFPKEASEIVLGDYANTSITADISLANVIPDDGGGGPLPDLPGLPTLPVADVLGVVTRCLSSGDVTSRSCRRVLGSVQLTSRLITECGKAKRRRNDVCEALGPLAGVGLDGVVEDALPGLPGLGRFSAALSSGDESPLADDSTLFGGSS